MNNTTFSRNVLNRTTPSISKEEIVYKLKQKIKGCNRVIDSVFSSIDDTDFAIKTKDFYLQILEVL